MTTSRKEEELAIAALASLWREGKISIGELSQHLKRRQLPLFPGLEKKFLPLFTPAEQEQLTLFLTAQQRQLTLSLVTEVKNDHAGNGSRAERKESPGRGGGRQGPLSRRRA